MQARRIASPAAVRAVASRSFTSYSPYRAPAAAAQPAAASAIPESSCPAGTVLKNLNYLKDASDPTALEDSAYPAWVWTLTESAQKQPTPCADEGANLRHQRKSLKRERKVSVKAANALKG
ncbi:hypothetical protein JCM8202v2_005375 [Rhodotorula sphaerocarpa]